jgi:hypothetical protein
MEMSNSLMSPKVLLKAIKRDWRKDEWTYRVVPEPQ